MNTICPKCNKEFDNYSKYGAKKFCSKTCANYRDQTNKQIIRYCLGCGNSTKNPRFCTRSCAASYNNTATPKRQKKNICATCKTIILSNRKYCSPHCNPRLLTQFSSEEKIKRTKAMHKEATLRYLAKRKNQTPSNIIVKDLQQFYFNCPVGYEVDHIVPISKGGLHSLENLQYLTASDNRRKSNKIL